MKTALKLLIAFILLIFCIRIAPKDALLDNIPYSSAVYAADGELLRLTVASDEIFRVRTPLSEISPHIIEATLFYEDRYFWRHFGINPFALARGFYTTYIKKSRTVGASTITMQLARNIYDIDSRTIPGKVNQILHAFWLEAAYSKKEILEAYLNIAPYGHNIEGVGAASLVYYHTRAANLSTVESMTLAVIPQNPAKRVPTTAAGWGELTKARNQLMAEWVKKHSDEADKLAHFELPMQIYKIADLPYLAPHFVDGVLLQNAENNAPNNEYFTTLNLSFQKTLERQIRTFVQQNRSKGIHNAAALLVNTRDMAVLAAVGSADFFDDAIQGQVNGTMAMRSPGSVLKPFIYGLAIDKGLIHPHTMLKDAPHRYGLYSPENSDRGFLGPIFAIDSLNMSRNIPAVDLLVQVGADDFLIVLKEVGVENLKDGDYYGAALALGGLEVSMEDIATLYSALNNGGQVKHLRKLQAEPIADGENILTPESAYIVRDMMQNNPAPNMGSNRYRKPFPIGWKTGTSYFFRDGWAAAVFGDYALVVWVGNFMGNGNASFMGRQSAGPLAFTIIDKIAPSLHPIPTNNEQIPVGLNIKYVDICAITGELPTDFCPEITQTLFIPGVSPIKQSDIFLQIPIDIETGLRACYYEPTKTRLEVYEFWPKDILDIFEAAGIRRKTPPRYMPDCSVDITAATGAAPTIQYPQDKGIYDLTNSPARDMVIPLTAVASGDVDKIFWFADGRYIGETGNGVPLQWKTSIGKYTLQATDNLGRTSKVNVEIL